MFTEEITIQSIIDLVICYMEVIKMQFEYLRNLKKTDKLPDKPYVGFLRCQTKTMLLGNFDCDCDCNCDCNCADDW